MVRLWRRFAVGLLITAALVGGGFAAAQTAGGLSHYDPHGQKLEAELSRLLNSASEYLDRHYRECRVLPPRSSAPPRLLHGPPDLALLATLAILRRPAGPGDTVPTRFLQHPDPFMSGIYVDYVRVAHAVDGAAFVLFPVRFDGMPQTPRVCDARRHDRLLELLEGKPNELRRMTLREDARLSREENPPGGIRPRDGLFAFSGANGNGGGGGGAGAATLRRSGSFGTSSANNGPSDVTGVIPDGVVSITAIYNRAVSQGPYSNPKTYPTRLVRNVRVQDNVINFTVPRPAGDGFPSRMIWHLANGSTRTVTQPQG